MKIAVIGAGIVGLSTAYELALDGHAVTVFERNAAVAEEASFACAGQLSASLSHPLAFPAWPSGSRLRALLTPSGITLGRGSTLRDLRWLKAWKAPAKDLHERMACARSLAAYSLQRLHTIAEQASQMHEQSQGQLLIFKSEAVQLQQQQKLQLLNQLGTTSKLMTPAEVRALEPALGADLQFHSGVFFAQDESGNCRQFAHLLKEKLMAAGVQIHFSTPVTAVSQGAGLQIQTREKGVFSFDQVVVCAGTGGADLIAPGFKQLALTRLWSTSISAHIREPLNAPRSALVDVQQQISISRMGARIRVSGGAALGRDAAQSSEKTKRLLFQALQNHFPGATDYSRSMQIWQGASVFSPDALPLVGAGDRPGMWLNLAHGHNGWTLACGAARVLADQISGRSAEIDATRLSPGRFRS